MEQYPCKCHETGRVCGGCAASLDKANEDQWLIDNFDEKAAASAIRETGLDICAPTLRSAELARVRPVSRSGL